MKPCNLNFIQRGFALISALFLLVVLGALGIYMVSISSTQQYTALYRLQSARAYFAARSGIEWGAATVIPPGSTVAVPCFPKQTISLGGNLNGFSVTVDCTSTQHYETPLGNYNVYVIDATGFSSNVNFGTPGYASRHIRVTLTQKY